MRKGKISNLKNSELKILVMKSISFSEILRSLNLDTSSGNFRTLKRKLNKENINYDHIKNGGGYDASKLNTFKKKIPFEEILVKNSTYSNPNLLKRRLIKEGILIEKCAKCGLKPIWNNERLCLQFDHINGISNDNRLENLQILCPNCHSQTSTYAARNKLPKIDLPKQKILRKTKIIWPSNEDLLLMISKSNYFQVGKSLGVSDNAIRKRLKNNAGT